MNSKVIWRTIRLPDVIEKLGSNYGLFPKIPVIAFGFMIAEIAFSEIIKFQAGRYEWEYDTTIGVYRFRDIGCGPWCQWKACEGA